MLCTDGPMKSLVDLALAPEHPAWARCPVRRAEPGPLGRRAAADRAGRPAAAACRRRAAGACRRRLAVAAAGCRTCPGRSFCHTYGRGDAKHRMVPGWPYSFVVALEAGCTSWTVVLDAVRLEPGADLDAVTTTQLRDAVVRLVAAG